MLKNSGWVCKAVMLAVKPKTFRVASRLVTLLVMGSSTKVEVSLNQAANGRFKLRVINPNIVPELVSAKVIFSDPDKLAPQKPTVDDKSRLLAIGGRLKRLVAVNVSGENAKSKVALA